MFSRFSPHTLAVAQALFVTFLWSTSWVLIKIGLEDEQIPALTFAGLRYAAAFLCLLPLFLRQPRHVAALRRLSRGDWLNVIVLGLLFYTVTQGAVFVGLAYLPAATVNLLFSLSTIVVAFLGIALLREYPTIAQWGGVVVYVTGVLVYFYPVNLPADQTFGILVVVAGVLANSASSVLGRALNRRDDLTALSITAASMGIGAIVLLGTGSMTQGMPLLSARSWLIIAWLAAVNTAYGFTLWNHTLRTLSAMESSIINNMMLAQIPVLAWLFLGEGISTQAGVGFALAALGVMIVQVRLTPPPNPLPIHREGE